MEALYPRNILNSFQHFPDLSLSEKASTLLKTISCSVILAGISGATYFIAPIIACVAIPIVAVLVGVIAFSVFAFRPQKKTILQYFEENKSVFAFPPKKKPITLVETTWETFRPVGGFYESPYVNHRMRAEMTKEELAEHIPAKFLDRVYESYSFARKPALQCT